jgi:hypothetical protein
LTQTFLVDAVTNDFPRKTANNDAAISELQNTVRELQARHDKMIGKLTNPTEQMMLAGALAHKRRLKAAERSYHGWGQPKIFLWP